MYHGWRRCRHPFRWELASLFYEDEHNSVGQIPHPCAKEICIRVGISATFEKQLDAYKQITASLRAYLLQLQQIDVEAFRRETEQFDRFAKYTDLIMDERQLNAALKASMIELGIRLPWDGDFDLFMRDKNKHLSFE